jgi:intraflagellar transport protein 56
MKRDAVNEAYDLIRDMEPNTPQEYIIKGVVNATMGQLTSNREQLKQV